MKRKRKNNGAAAASRTGQSLEVAESVTAIDEAKLYLSLSVIIDVLYGALIGYAFVLLASAIKSALTGIYDVGSVDHGTFAAFFLVFNTTMVMVFDLYKVKMFSHGGLHVDAVARARSEVYVAAIYFLLLCLAEIRTPLIIPGYAILSLTRILWLRTLDSQILQDAILGEVITASVWILTFLRLEDYGLNRYEPGGVGLAAISGINVFWGLINWHVLPFGRFVFYLLFGGLLAMIRYAAGSRARCTRDRKRASGS